MKKQIATLLIIILGPLSIMGQYQIKDLNGLNAFEQIPKETMFIHYNDRLLVAGEYLYYKMYCLNALNLTPSDISKIGYVELVGENKKPVFTHKLELINGIGQGDFFVPANIKTGNYKLIGYTKWMGNTEKEHYFVSGITIVNPFQEIMTLPVDKIHSLKVVDTSYVKPMISKDNIKGIKIELQKKRYQKRKPVSIKIIATTGISEGNYSISVRKIYGLTISTRTSATNFASDIIRKPKSAKLKIKDTVLLPELRGELFSGKVVSIKEGNPIPNEKVALSIPGKPSVMRLTQTNENGVFYFSVDEPSRNNNAILQTLGINETETEIILDKNHQVDYKALEFDNLDLAYAINPIILERSTYNQIENAYFEQKKDSLFINDKSLPAYQSLTENYILDDYKRFPSLKETVIEIIPDVLLRKMKKEYRFQVRINEKFLMGKDENPLVRVDGVFTQNMDKLLNYDVKKIERISIGRSEYYIGTNLYQGIIDISTKENDFWNSSTLIGTTEYDMPAPLAKKIYYFQTYRQAEQSNTDYTRIPDFRNQLLWKPNFELSEGETLLTFFTSDNTGTYEVVVEGFTNSGKAISAVIHFEIE